MNKDEGGLLERQKPGIDWINVIFLTGTPLAAFAGVGWYVAHYGFHWADFLLFATLYMMTGISITAGYHRYYTHRAYECHRVVQLFFLIFGGAAVQNSVLHWSSDHRDHHRFVDTDDDPYDIMKGIFWAHMGWIFYEKKQVHTYSNVPDLRADPLVMWQHRYYLPLTFAVSAGLPLLIGFAYGHPVGAFLWGGLLRVVFCHHGTFLINSASHYFGTQPYDRSNSSRDNKWLALLTFGEGYHNFHHAFQADYRNGIAWYHWDPSKWCINALKFSGLAWRLNRASECAIQKTRMRVEVASVKQRLDQHPSEWRDRVWAQLQGCRERAEVAMSRAAVLRHRYQEWVVMHASKAGAGMRARKAGWVTKLRRARHAAIMARAQYRRFLRDLNRQLVPLELRTEA